MEDAAAEASPNVVRQDAIIPTRQFAVVVSVGIVPRGMTACQVVDVARPVRSAAETASVITPKQRLAVLELGLFGRVQSPVTAVQLASVPTPRLKGVARMAPA
jgi:hypothetical protein